MPRLNQGDLINGSHKRTPLAIAYDGIADQFILQAIEAKGGWVARLIESPPFAPYDRGGLTDHERAFKQACYYHRRIYRHGQPYYVYDELGRRFENPNPERTHALEMQWPELRVRNRRMVRVRVHAIGEASLWAEEHYG